MGSAASCSDLESEKGKPLDASDLDVGDGGAAAIREVQRLRRLLAANHGLVQKLLLNAAVDDIADSCDAGGPPPSDGPGSAVADLDEAEAEEKSDGAPASPGAKDDKAACDAAVRDYVARRQSEPMSGSDDPLDAEIAAEMHSALDADERNTVAALPESKMVDDDDDWE